MPQPPPDPAQPASAAALDVSAYQLLPLPVAWCDAAGRWLGGNAAFHAFTGWPADWPTDGAATAALPGDVPPGDGSGQALQALLRGGRDATDLPWRGVSASGQPLAALLSLRWHASGWCVATLLPQPVAAAASVGNMPLHWPNDSRPPAAAALRKRLDTAQRLARFGSWSHDLRTGQGSWDAQVWRFWGRAPQANAPSLDEWMAAVHPDDRAEANALYRRSLTAPGSFSHSYRLCDSSGAELQVRSMWQVQAGSDGLPALVNGIVIDDTASYLLAQHASEAQAQLNLVLSLADIAIWQFDQASGLLRTGALGWALLGWADQPQGLPLAQVAERLDNASGQALLAELQAELQSELQADASTSAGAGPVDLELRCRRPDGRWRTLLTRRLPQRGSAGQAQGHVGVMLDLSERFDAQQQALVLAARLEMATSAAGVGVWNVQLSKPPQVHWDAQMRRLHGLAPDQNPPPMDAYAARHVHEADRDHVHNSLAVLLQRSEGMLDMDLRIVLPDGSVRRLATRTSISSEPRRRQLHGVVLDVTERHASEERLRQAGERATLAARGAGIGTWESDAQAEAGWWDTQMFRLRGLDRPTALVRTDEMMQWLHPADRDACRRMMRAAVADDSATNTEFRVVWPDGTLRWLASRSTPVRDDSGRTVRRIGINWDITDAHNAAAAREERLLAQRERQAKARFLARISHELRTPLNAVLGFSQLLLVESQDGHAPDPGTWRSRVAQVQASGEHLLALIDDVLELSSLESGELPLSLQPVALVPLVQTSLPLVELLARQHGVALRLGLLSGWVLADPVRLRQVLLNLLSNAIKYNRPGGQVTVSAEASNGWWLLRVEDSGRGLSTAQLQHLFEPFNRLGAEREGIAGTGIGLAIVQASVQQMGGTVQVRSSLGAGSVFELVLQQSAEPLPTAVGAAEAGATPPPPPLQPLPLPLPLPTAATGAARPKLLYIEDNDVNMMIVRELVRQRPDLDFHGAPDGASGLALAAQLLPALILLDLQLPDMDGHAVLRQLRSTPATAAIRCIALSANAMPEDIRAARAAGFDDYWTKPLDLSAFLRALARLFGPAADQNPGDATPRRA